MVTHLLIGTAMMVLTTGVHTLSTVLVVVLLNRRVHRREHIHPYDSLALISATILLYFTATLIEVGIWAAAYVKVGAIAGIERSLYFSMVTFTTLGYGDIVLSDRWRLLSSFEAANGLIMFGWTTAVAMVVVQRTFSKVLERLRR